MQNDKTVNIGVIGTGYWGPNHVRVFNNLVESRVVGVADLDQTRLERIRFSHPSVRTTQDYRTLLEDPQIQAIVIATPTTTHYSLVKEAILAGKHVLCEKPLCSHIEQANELVELAKTHQRQVVVGHVFLFNAGIIKLKELVEASELGRLHYLSATRTNLGPIRNDVNAAYDLATHDIAIFNWLVGMTPTLVSATGAAFVQPTIEDIAFISLRYANGVMANIIASWLDPKKVRQITVVGSQRMATWDDLQPATPVAIYDKGVQTSQEYSDYGEFLRLSMWDGDVRMPKIRVEEPLKLQALDFIRSIHTGEESRSNATFALGVIRTLEAIERSIKSNGQPVEV